MKITKSGIKIDRELSALDKFAIDFSRIMQRHTKYVIVSGYVSILMGRARVSEDIDMLVPVMGEEEWSSIYNDLVKEGYYCLNADVHGSYTYLKDNIAVRFAPKGSVIPNMEILFAAGKIQKIALATGITAAIGKSSIVISNLELQIAYKENILKSPKDIEDARHIRLVMGKHINAQRLREYKRML
ncbi:MAG: hypothetical protein NT120_03390 [Candidatus Aenigmarchaeota archaeon]|nr:hypothetical protein [Candidatus Aenigmarchaeota archaeon]